MLYRLLRPVLFSLDPEGAHDGAISALKIVQQNGLLRSACRSVYCRQIPSLEQTLWGVRFANPVGLAAGLDKNAEVIDGLACLGFGFVEAGTLTPQPQSGNPKPRVFRLPVERALINRLGFNNIGVERAARQLALRRRSLPLGINIGKNRDTAAAAAAEDYRRAFEAVFPHCDYVVINVSSPNTPGLRDFQKGERLRDIVQAVCEANANLARAAGRAQTPVLIKVSPDLALRDLEAMAELAVDQNLAGLVAVNTTTAPCLKRPPTEQGGISGVPLADRATLVLRHLYKHYGSRLRFIGVGGIFSAADAYERIRCGASLVQVYTGLVYEGPGLVRRIAKGIAARLRRDGFRTISEAVGTALT